MCADKIDRQRWFLVYGVVCPDETCRNLACLYKCVVLDQLVDSNLIDMQGANNTVQSVTANFKLHN